MTAKPNASCPACHYPSSTPPPSTTTTNDTPCPTAPTLGHAHPNPHCRCPLPPTSPTTCTPARILTAAGVCLTCIVTWRGRWVVEANHGGHTTGGHTTWVCNGGVCERGCAVYERE